MNKAKKLLVLSLVSVGAISLSGCNLFKKKNKGNEEQETLYFSFSVGLKSGASCIALNNKNEQVSVFDNGIDSSGRSYSYESTDPNVATIDANGKITPVKTGRVNFRVTESKSGIIKALKKDIVITENASASKGGYNFAGGTSTEELATRAEILGKLEKYAMDTHLTGITLFENGGLVKYSSRVEIPTKGKQFIEGYGFGILTDGRLNGTLTGTDGGTTEPTYYHSSMAQDSMKINQYSAAGSQVSDLASYITSSYWGTKLNNDKDNYEWYPVLATDNVRKPVFDENGKMTDQFEANAVKNNEPIAIEDKNNAGLYKKWRIYVKTDGVNGVNLKYSKYKVAEPGKSNPVVDSAWNGRGVTIEDYLFAYELLFTGSNNILRGTEMANDTSYGIKGAQRFFNATKSVSESDASKHSTFVDYIQHDKLGLKTGNDVNGDYIDIELINAIDSFTAMYTLSSNLVCPIPRDFFVGSSALADTMRNSVEAYGTFNGEDDNAILNNTICLGAYTLRKWIKDSEIVFERNDNWFEYSPSGQRYQIPGVYIRKVDTSTDTEKNWKQLEKGNLDSAGVPTSKVEENRNRNDVYATKGDATFKLNVNSCTQEQWNELFGPNGKVKPNAPYWECKPWMSNSDFLDGLFYSVDRQAFATKRGVNPSIDYLSNAYQMRNSDGGSAYNKTDAHKEAVKDYSDNYGYNLNKAIDCFRNAVKQLSSQGKLVLGESKDKPTVINIDIIWMYQSDPKEYGEDIKFYFERAFNDDSVCGGKVKLNVRQDAVTNWEDVYTKHMMQGNFDLGFGAISGNTYNPLNFMEVLKSDNSSQFTLNWGPDTSKIDEKNPIIYKGQKWSYDALWEVADHGGIVENGEKIKPVRTCTASYPTKLGETGRQPDLYKGFDLELQIDFASFNESGSRADFDINRIDCYIFGSGNRTLAEDGDSNLTVLRDSSGKITGVKVTVDSALAEEINTAIKTQNGFKDDDADAWHKNPFIMTQFDKLFTWELYYELSINGGSSSVNYYPVETSDE